MIISSVGHETDTTISDYVADLRAPTPSGGAELAVPDQLELITYLERMNNQNRLSLSRIMKSKIEDLKRIKSSFIFRDPLRITENKSRRLDHLSDKLELLNPINRLKQSQDDLIKTTKRLNDYYLRTLNNKSVNYNLLINKLELLNPLSIMKKGYSVVKKEGKVLKSINEVKVNENIDIHVNDGVITANITSKRKGV